MDINLSTPLLERTEFRVKRLGPLEYIWCETTAPGNTDCMQIRHTAGVFDAAGIETKSAFWTRTTGGTVTKDDDCHSIRIIDRVLLAVQLAPDHAPPDWPHGTPPHQIHLDLWIDDIDATEDEVLRLGGRPLEAVDEDTFRVYANPAGHPSACVGDVCT
jgi:hypothetical protein